YTKRRQKLFWGQGIEDQLRLHPPAARLSHSPDQITKTAGRVAVGRDHEACALPRGIAQPAVRKVQSIRLAVDLERDPAPDGRVDRGLDVEGDLLAPQERARERMSP